MTFFNGDFAQFFPRGRKSVILLILGLIAIAVIGLIAALQPILALAIVGVLFLAIAMFARPNASTLVVLFILYTNAAVVAVRFHGVPYIVGVAFPILLISPLGYYLIFRRQKIIVNQVILLLILFLGIQALSAFFARFTSVVMQSLTTYMIEGVLIYFLIINTIRSLALLRQAIWVLLLAGTLIASLSVYQQVTQSFDNNFGGFAQMSNAAFGTGVELLAGEVYQPRLAGTIGDQNYHAQLMLMLVPLGLFRVWGERSKLLRLLALVFTAVIALGVGLTFSRGAAVGFLLMLVIMALLRYIKLYQLALIFIGLLLLLRALPQYGARLISLETVIGALGGVEGSGIRAADSSTESRLTEMAAAGLAFADHPLIGVGPGMFKYYYPQYAETFGLRVQATYRAAHNLYLDIAADTGVLGLVCFLAILFVSLRNLVQTRRRWLQTRPDLANLATGLILAIVTYLTTGLFLTLAYERFFWLMLALAGVTSCLAGISAHADPDSTLELRRV